MPNALEAAVQPQVINRDMLAAPIETKNALFSPISDILPEFGGQVGTNVPLSKFSTEMPFGADPIEFQAQAQSSGSRLAHGLGRLITTTGTKFMEGLGYTISLLPAIIGGDGDIMFDNAWSSYWSSLGEKAKEAMPIYHSRKYLEGDILTQITTLGFWMDDVIDGAAFMASALIGSKGISALGKATNVYSKLGKSFSSAAKAAKLGKASGMTAKSLNLATQEMELVTMSLYNSVSEAGFEAKDIKDQVLNELRAKVESGEMTIEEANVAASKAARNTFVSNVFALMPSNYVTNSMFFKTFKGVKSNLVKARAAKQAGTLDDFTRFTRGDAFAAFGKEAGKSVLSEGFWEENIQLAIQNLEKGIAVGDIKDKDKLLRLANEWVNNYFTDEGQKAIALGAIIGLIPGGVGGIRAAKQDKADAVNTVKLIERTLTRHSDGTNHLFKRKVVTDENNEAKEYANELELDENGMPIPDYNKVAGEFIKAMKSSQGVMGLIEAAEANNQIMFDFLRSDQFSTWALDFLVREDGLEHAKTEVDSFTQQEIQELQQRGESVQTQEEVQELNKTYKDKLSQLQRVWDNISLVTDAMSLGKDAAALRAREYLKIAQYRESSRQIFYEEKLRDVEAEIADLETGTEVNLPQTKEILTTLNKQAEQLRSVINDSQEKLADMFNEKKLKEEWAKSSADIEERARKATEKAKKDAEKVKEEDKREEERQQEQDLAIGEKYKVKDPDGTEKSVELTEFTEDGIVMAQEVDEEGEFIGEPFELSPEEAERLRQTSPVKPEVEAEPITIAEAGSAQPEARERKLKQVFDALTTMHFVEGQKTPEIRNEEFDKYSSDPNNKMDNGTANFSIDFNALREEFWDQLDPEVVEKLKRTDLTIEQVTDLFTLKDREKFNNLLDKVPIGATIEDGGQTFRDGIFFHESGYDNFTIPKDVTDPLSYIKEQKYKTRATRLHILQRILTGQEVKFKTRGKTFGYANKVEGAKNNIITTLGINPNQPGLGIVDYTESAWITDNASATDKMPSSYYGKWALGLMFVQTTRTASGDKTLVAVNPSKLSEQHAGILFDALELKHTYGSGGNRATFAEDYKDVEGLNAGQIINLLALTGRKTAMGYPRNRGKNYLVDKQLYVSKDGHTLNYGTEKLDLHNVEERDANRQKFIEWATANKNYAVNKKIKSLNVELNKPFNQEFKLGSWEVKKDKRGNLPRYSTWLMQNNAITTNLELVNDNSVFHGPVILMDVPNVEDEIVKPKEAKKRPKVAPKDPKKPAPVRKENVESAKDLINLPLGAQVYFKRKGAIRVLVEIVQEKGKARFKSLVQSGVLKSEIDGQVAGNRDIANKLYTYIRRTDQAGETGEIFIDYDATSLAQPEVTTPPQAEQTTQSESAIEETPTNKPVLTPEEILKRAEQIGKEDAPLNRINKYGSTKEYVVHDLEKELSWFHKRFGNVPVNITDRLISVVKKNNTTSFGQMRWDSILLYKAAEVGSLYHESFHRVTQLYMDEEERKQLYDSARKELGLEDMTDRQVEEVLAERFRDYVMLEGEKKETNVIKRWFKELYDMIVNFFVGPKRLNYFDINSLFKAVQSGRFRYAKASKENIARVKLESDLYYRTIKGAVFETIQTTNQLRSIVKGLTNTLFNLTMTHTLDGLIDFNSLKNINEGFVKLKQTLIERRDSYYKVVEDTQRVENWDQKKKDEFTQTYQRYGDLYAELVDNYPKIEELIGDKLLEYNFRIKSTRTLERKEDEESDMDGAFERYQLVSYEHDPKDNVLSSVKFLIASLHESDERDAFTNMYNFVDFSTMWDRLMYELHDSPTVEDAMDRLEKKLEGNYAYQQLHSKLRLGTEDLRTQFWVSVRQHRHEFMNSLFTRGQGGTLEWEFTDADIQRAQVVLVKMWNDTYTLSAATAKDDRGALMFNDDYIQEVFAKYNTLTDEVIKDMKDGVLNNYKAYIDSIVGILNEFSIMVDAATVDEYITTKGIGPHEGLSQLVIKDMAPLFKKGTSIFLGKSEKSIETMFSDESFIRAMADTYVHLHPEEINNSVIGAAGSIYYTYSQASFVTEAINLLVTDDEFLARMSNTVYSQRSRFLTALRDNIPIVQEKEGVGFVFDQNPQLVNIGTKEQYSAYINTKFPDSKVNDIVYHGTKSADKILEEGFKEGFEGTANRGVKGFHFAFDLKDAKHFGTPEGEIIPAIINVTEKDLIDVDEILVYSNDRIHILGSKQDIEGFKDFIKNRKSDIRKVFKVRTFSGLLQRRAGDSGRKYQDITRFEDYVTKLNLVLKGKIPFPSMADRSTYYVYEGMPTMEFRYEIVDNKLVIPESIVDQFVDYAKDERDRIEQTKREIAEAKELHLEDSLVQNYHYRTDGKKANGLSYQHFPSFNHAEFDFDRDAKPEIRKILEERIDQELVNSADSGVIKFEDGFYSNRFIDTNTVNEVTKDYGQSEDKAVRSLIAEFTVNTMMSVIETEKIFSGDPAFYKPDGTGSVTDDKIKRLSVLTSTGTLLRLNHPDYAQNDYTVSTFDTQRMQSPVYNQLLEKHVELLKASGMSAIEAKKEAETNLKDYKRIDSTDAQVYIKPEMYKQIAIRLGEWSPAIQQAYDLLESDKTLSAEEERKALAVVMKPLKLVYFGPTFEGEKAIPVYDKMSLATLFRRMVKGKDAEQLLNRMEDEHEPIDMVKFESAVKVGVREKKNFYEDDLSTISDLKDMPQLTQSFQFLRRQLVTDPHDIQRTKTGTQFLKVGIGNLNLTENVYSLRGEDVNGQTITNEVYTALGDLSRKGRKRVLAKFGMTEANLSKVNKEKLLNMLRKDAKQAGMPDSVTESLTMEQGLELDALPDRRWIYSRILSAVGKETADINLPGNQFIQQSNFGFKGFEQAEDLQFLGENGMEARVSINLIKHMIPGYKTMTWAQKKAFVENDLRIIGYRIPTQGQNSIVTLKIKELLPEQSGDTIILPNEFTALTGSDFDIDKLFVVRYNYDQDGNSVTKTPFLEGDDTFDLRYQRAILSDFYKSLDVLTPQDQKMIAEVRKDIHSELSERLTFIAAERTQFDILNEERRDAVENEYWDDVARIDMDILDYYEEYNVPFDLKAEVKKEFIEVASSILIAKGILPTKDKFRKMSIWEQNTREAVENRLLDSYFAVLDSDEHFIARTSPLGIMTGKLKEMAKLVRKAEGSQRKLGSLESASPTFQTDAKMKYIMGKSGIGPFALANVHHILSQTAGLKMKGKLRAPILRDEKGMIDLSQKVGLDGVNILEWLSALIDAHVDVAKDPYVIDLNVNSATYNVVSLLLRAGAGEIAFTFLSQPILKEYAERYLRNRGRLGRGPKDIFTELREELSGHIDSSEKAADELIRGGTIWDETNLMEQIEEPNPYFQMEVLNQFEEINKQGQFLFEATQASQVDTKRYGKNFSELRAFLNTLGKVYTDNKFVNFDKIMPWDKVNNEVIEVKGSSHLGEMLNNSVILPMKAMSGQLVEATDGFADLHQMIRTRLGHNFTRDSKIINEISNQIYSWLSAEFFVRGEAIGMTSGKLERLLKGDKSVLTEIRNIKQGHGLATKHPELINNHLIKHLNYTFLDDPQFESFITIPSTRDSDKFAKDTLTMAWEELFEHPDPAVQSFAKNLMMFSYYTSGFKRGIFSFYHFIPPQAFKELQHKDGVLSYNEFIKEKLNELQAPNSELYRDVVDEVIRNNWWNDIFVARPRDDVEMEIKVSGKDINTVRVAKIPDANLYIGKNKYKQHLYKPYVLIESAIPGGRQLMKYIGYDTVDDRPVYAAVDKMSYYNRGILVKEYGFTKSIFPENTVEHKPEDPIKSAITAYPGLKVIDSNNASVVELFDSFDEMRAQEEMAEPIEVTVKEPKVDGEIRITKEVQELEAHYEAQRRIQDRTEDNLEIC